MKKCPSCSSSRFRGNDILGKHCENCGYIWKPSEACKQREMARLEEVRLIKEGKLRKIREREMEMQRKLPEVNSHEGVIPREYKNSVNSIKSVLQPLKTNSKVVDNNEKFLKIDYHSTVYKFKILRNSDQHLKNTIALRGWNQEWVESEKSKVMKTPYNLIVYLKKRRKRRIADAEEILQMGLEQLKVAKEEAIKVANLINIDIDIANPVPVQKEIKICEPFITGFQFNTDLVKDVYPSGEIEWKDPKQAEQHVINFLKNMSILSNYDKLMESNDVLLNAMLEFTKQLQIHYGVLIGIRDAITELKDTVILLVQPKEKLHQKLWVRFRKMVK